MDRIKTGDRELRKVFTDTLQKLMDADHNVVYLEADLAGAIGTSKLFQSNPEQAYDIGIMEANMIGVAAGMSVKGKIPFVHSFGTFASRRCADQTFVSGCYNNANVKIVGSDPGIAAETNGGTHMPLEDIAVYRAFPGLKILDVADPILLAYIRFPRKCKKFYYNENQYFQIGKAVKLREGSDVTIIAAGLEVFEALEAAEMLQSMNISAEILDMFTIKPIDKDAILESAAKTGCVVTAENHNIIGGLGSAVAEVLIEELPVPMKRIGSRDHFGEVGSQEFLKGKFHLAAEDIFSAAKEVLRKKK